MLTSTQCQGSTNVQQNWRRQKIFHVSWSPQRLLLANYHRQTQLSENDIHMEGSTLPVYTSGLRSYVHRIDFLPVHSKSLIHCRVLCEHILLHWRQYCLKKKKKKRRHLTSICAHWNNVSSPFANLRLNPDKCTFLPTEVKFLGCIMGSRGFRTDPGYVQAIKVRKPQR